MTAHDTAWSAGRLAQPEMTLAEEAASREIPAVVPPALAGQARGRGLQREAKPAALHSQTRTMNTARWSPAEGHPAGLPWEGVRGHARSPCFVGDSDGGEGGPDDFGKCNHGRQVPFPAGPGEGTSRCHCHSDLSPPGGWTLGNTACAFSLLTCLPACLPATRPGSRRCSEKIP